MVCSPIIATKIFSSEFSGVYGTLQENIYCIGGIIPINILLDDVINVNKFVFIL